MSVRPYSVVVISDELLHARLQSLDEWELMGRIGPLCQNALQAKGLYERAMMQRERSTEAAFDAGRRCAPESVSAMLWPILACAIATSLGLGAGILMGGGFFA